MDSEENADAPKELPHEMTEDVRNMTASYKVIDTRKYFNLIKYKPYSRQWLFHLSKVRFKLPIAGRRAGKTQMVGKDVQPLLLIPGKRIWAVGPCVDEETEIMTDKGWKRYDEVREGDQTLSINPITGLSEWDTVTHIIVRQGSRSVIRMEGHSFSSVTTPDHRWLTHRRPNIGYRAEGSKLPKVLRPIAHLLPATSNGWTWRTTATLTADDRIPRAAVCDDIPIQAKYSDEFVELVAWIWTEGSFDSSAFSIHQSNKVNEENVTRIRHALMKICPNPVLTPSGSSFPTEYWSERTAKSSPDKTVFYLGKELSREFCQVFLKHKVVDSEFIKSLTWLQLKLFVEVSLLGDGTSHDGSTDGYEHTQKVIYQENTEQLFAVQLACALLGKPTSIRQRSKNIADGFVLGILTKQFINPKRARYVAGAQGMRITKEAHTGVVWCVTTKNGNWLAKRRSSVYYTANSYDLGEKEFRVIWDDMIIKLGFGREPSVKKAYSKKQGNMFIEFPWQTRIEVRSAERPDNLVGEKLDYVIMSEAAKHSKETWDRFIRPALSDNRGGASFGSTPNGMNWLHQLWQYGQNPEFPDFDSWRYPAWENPYIYPLGRNDPEIKLLERTMPREWFLQEIAAEFTSFMGRIYSEFDEKVHVKQQKYNPLWKSYGSFDWGFVNPLAFVEFQVDPMDRVHVWREHYLDRVRLEDHIEMLKNRPNPPGYQLDLCFGDAADPEAVATVCAKFGPCVAMPESKENWREGVELVKGFLKTQQVSEADEYGTPVEEPWLFVDHSCVNLIREFNNYRVAPRTVGRAERNPREDSQKYDDHLLDALRYGIMHIFKLGANMRLSSVVSADELRKDIPEHGFFTANMKF